MRSRAEHFEHVGFEVRGTLPSVPFSQAPLRRPIDPSWETTYEIPAGNDHRYISSGLPSAVA